jgi:hypothetical protein
LEAGDDRRTKRLAFDLVIAKFSDFQVECQQRKPLMLHY